MKKISCFLCMLAIVCSTTSLYAHHHRVSNVPGASAAYTSVQTAHDASGVLAGDTLFVEPSGLSYGDLTWTKSLVIIGNGYLLASNPETQANTGNSKLGTVVISGSTSGSVITGCDINQLYLTNNVHNIFIKRNLAHNISFDNNPGGNIFILQNYIDGGIYSSGVWTNIWIENNIIPGVINLTQNNYVATATLLNNVMGGTLSATGCTLKNNIAYYSNMSYFTMINCSVYNNIGVSTNFGTDNGNQSNVNMADVFVCWPACPTYSADGRFQLKPGSVATGAGFGGIDCGAFAGNYPYVLSGLPTVPAIYYLNVQPADNSLNVSVKIKSHN